MIDEIAEKMDFPVRDISADLHPGDDPKGREGLRRYQGGDNPLHRIVVGNGNDIQSTLCR